MTVFAIVFNMIYPTVIMPLFNKMSPMEDTPLRTRIYEIAEKVGFRVGRIQVIDSSTRTGHSNAAAYGLFGVNGILIYDTLMDQLTDDEIIAVICHELGHWKFSHVYRVLMFLVPIIYSSFSFNLYIICYSSNSFLSLYLIMTCTLPTALLIILLQLAYLCS